MFAFLAMGEDVVKMSWVMKLSRRCHSCGDASFVESVWHCILALKMYNINNTPVLASIQTKPPRWWQTQFMMRELYFFLKYLEQPEGWTTTDNWLCYPGTCFNFLEQAKTLLDSLELKNIYIRDLKQSILSRTTRKDMKNRFKKWALFGWSLRSADLVVRFFCLFLLKVNDS